MTVNFREYNRLQGKRDADRRDRDGRLLLEELTAAQQAVWNHLSIREQDGMLLRAPEEVAAHLDYIAYSKSR